MKDLETSREALERFETIWEHVECGITIIDAQTREILDINPVASRMFGDDKEKIIGKRCHKFICPTEKESCPIMDKNQTVDRSERRFVRADGKIIPIIKSVAKIYYNGRQALLESFTDISKLKEAEQKLLQLKIAEQASKAKSDFLSRMSHEMRTPMNAIIGMTRIAEKTDDVDRLKYCLSMIGVSSAHLLDLINDILDMSKIEAGKLELNETPFHLEKTLIKICNLIMDSVEQKHIDLKVIIDPDVGQMYIGDELRLKQVLTNLLSNALKFTPEGGRIALSVEEAERDQKFSRLRFAVSDTGIGMNQEQMQRLFRAFEQADNSISRKFGGTGLGLVISKNIVEKMGGTIWTVSEPGQGSTFTFEVLIQRVRDEQPAAPVFAPAAVRLLVVDGDVGVRKYFRSIVGHHHISVEEADSGAQAILAVEASAKAGLPYDGIFIDRALPDMDALEIVRGFHGAADPDTIVVMTSFFAWSGMDKTARGVGIRRFMTKPLFSSTIMECLEAMLPGKAVQKPREVAARQDLSGLTILLVEDVEINREIFSALLEDTGVIVHTAENGREAIEKFASDMERYDMIFMDIQMPEMDGYQATRHIRALDSDRAKSIPIIAMTANAFSEDVERSLAYGMNGHLTKPINEEDVIEKILFFSGWSA